MSTNQSAERVLTVLDLLMRNFVHGMTPTDIVKATGFSAPNVTRYVATLEATGWAERIPETSRIRASVRLAQRSEQIRSDLEQAQRRIGELQNRINNSRM
ncbi:helix-turn-helix domain-containing protein [Oceanobacter mangrovi]|uniref:helix-turn-helix domain-containing protein n=1 Tax=Oceanobacter mangrovi TaxID=2862510 RepID=UPI001C8DB64B|nr:helix-turn-helix domain-containing protein [Oceanobacter mangrovi]